MKPVYQTIFNATEGNCFSACLASVLELPIEDVPNFCANPSPHWFADVRSWLNPFGLDAVNISVSDLSVYEARGYYLLGGTSTRGPYLHSVVAYNGVVVHDPNPKGDGVLLPPYDVTVFIHLLENPPKRGG